MAGVKLIVKCKNESILVKMHSEFIETFRAMYPRLLNKGIIKLSMDYDNKKLEIAVKDHKLASELKASYSGVKNKIKLKALAVVGVKFELVDL